MADEEMFKVEVIGSPRPIQAGDRSRAGGRSMFKPVGLAPPTVHIVQPEAQTELPFRQPLQPAAQVATSAPDQPQAPPVVDPNAWEPTTPHRYWQALEAGRNLAAAATNADLAAALAFLQQHCLRSPDGSLVCRPVLGEGGQPMLVTDWLRQNYGPRVTPTESARTDAYGVNQVACYSSGIFESESHRQAWIAMHPGCPEPPVESVASPTITMTVHGMMSLPLVPVALAVGGVAVGSLVIFLIAKSVSKPKRSRPSDDDDDEEEEE